MRFAIASWIAMIIFMIPCPAETIHVPGDEPTIQAGIDAAADGDLVLVASGTFVENIAFRGKAITVKSELGPSSTTIHGAKPVDPDFASCVVFINGEGPDTVLDGFTLQSGRGTNCQPWGIQGFCGGGILCLHPSSPTIMNCIVRDNEAVFYGGGMCILQGDPTLIDCHFVKNTLTWDTVMGGGLYNDAGNPVLKGCSFIENSTQLPYTSGAGMYTQHGNPVLKDCTFERNTLGAWYDDGGAGLHIKGGKVMVTGCLFRENQCDSGGDGGGLLATNCDLELTNSLFIRNQPGWFGGWGGALYARESNVLIDHCTFFENHYGGIAHHSEKMLVNNSIFWRNQSGNIANYGSHPCIVFYSCVEDGYPGPGNIDEDPLFVDPDQDDLHLTYYSPCRNAGDDTGVLVPVDFEGDPRIAMGRTDMGVDEFHDHLYCMGEFTPCGAIEGKLVGVPGASPVGLFIGSGVLDPPVPTAWGNFHLQAPWFLLPLAPIPPKGVLELPATIPATPAGPYDLPMQALIGLAPDSLTNLFLLEVH
jgi:hypothetical protein